MVAKKKTSSDDTYVFDGKVLDAPDWVDRSWAGYHAGPALHVPNGNPQAQPYTTTPCQIGDTITRKAHPSDPKLDEFTVTKAVNPGVPQEGVDPTSPTGPTFRPAQETTATLEDLVKTGATTPEDMDPEARAQYELRQGTSDPGPAAAEKAKDEGKAAKAKK